MDTLAVSSFGPISKGEVVFGDLTVLVGPQASGKSLLVQLYKAIEDAGAIRKNLKQHGYDWHHESSARRAFISLYFGGGMQSIWCKDTRIEVDGDDLKFMRRVVKTPPRSSTTESVFLIPAQRVLMLQDGWPRPFMSYSDGDPYCLRHFSDAIRKLMEKDFAHEDAIFPRLRRLKAELRRLIDHSIYVGGSVALETDGVRKRVVLKPWAGGPSLTYSAWSAGQREFTPMLLGLYWLMPGAKISRRPGVKSVVIEEPEMGLHPQAIVTFCLIVLELLHRGYRVVVSTHSPVFLDIVWALRELGRLKSTVAIRALKSVFGVERLDDPMRRVFASALRKVYHTFYFRRKGSKVTIADISSLDPGDADPSISGWGGLSGFSGHIADAVADALREGKR